jgi:hypothetical protein
MNISTKIITYRQDYPFETIPECAAHKTTWEGTAAAAEGKGERDRKYQCWDNFFILYDIENELRLIIYNTQFFIPVKKV